MYKNMCIKNFYIKKSIIERKLHIDKKLVIERKFDKNCDLICSGPSSENINIKTNNIIVVNYSILNKNVNNINNLDKDIIWIMGPNYRYFENENTHHVFIDCISKLIIKPKYLYVSYAGKQYENNFQMFAKAIKKRFENTIIQTIVQTNAYSSGILGLDYTIKNYDKIFVSGIELGQEEKYTYNKEFEYLYSSEKYQTGKKTPILPRHLIEDIKYITQLNIICLNKLREKEI